MAMSVGFLMTSCVTPKEVGFMPGAWNIDAKHKIVSSTDSTYVFPLTGNYDSTALVICSDADLKNYHRLDRYLSNLKKKAGLSEAQMLVYVPEENSLWLKLPENYKYERPKSITVNLYEEHPYTVWVRPSDMEQWDRKPTEMYTYTYYDNHQKWLCVVDMFDYADIPIARMSILQTATKQFNSVGLPASSSFPFSTTSIDYIEMLANWVDGHREVSIKNYKKGDILKLVR